MAEISQPAPKKDRVGTTIMASLLAGLGGALLMFVVLWLTVVSQNPTRTEVVELLNTRSPYIQDRQLLLQSVRDNKDATKRLADDLSRVATVQTQVVTKLDVIIAQLAKADLN